MSDDSSIILKYVLKSWDRIIETSKIVQVKKLAISFFNLQKASAQFTFLDFNEQKKRQKISRVIDHINKKLGTNTVSIGIISKNLEEKQIIAFSHIPKASN
ncbi:MAG: hypothetical protein AB8B67_04690 [Rickettsiaceae bacterium]